MALPQGFNEFEHLQSIYRKEHNKLVRNYFQDLGNEDWDPDISTPRGSLRHACTIKDADSAIIMNIRHRLFFDILGYGKQRLGYFYGMPAIEYQESFVGKPQVFLYFTQDRDAVPDNYTPIDAEIRFRLMNETSQTMTPAKSKALANKIKTQMVVGNQGILFTKSKSIATYTDKSKGYKLQVYVLNESEGLAIIKKILLINEDTFEEDKFKLITPKKKSITTITGTQLVYGKQRKKRRWRPTGKVRFRQAYMYIHGMETMIPLVDTTGYWEDALVQV